MTYMFCNRLLALKLKQLFGGSCQPFGLMKGGGGGKKGKGKESENRGDKIYIYMQMVKLECATD